MPAWCVGVAVLAAVQVCRAPQVAVQVVSKWAGESVGRTIPSVACGTSWWIAARSAADHVPPAWNVYPQRESVPEIVASSIEESANCSVVGQSPLVCAAVPSSVVALSPAPMVMAVLPCQLCGAVRCRCRAIEPAGLASAGTCGETRRSQVKSHESGTAPVSILMGVAAGS